MITTIIPCYNAQQYLAQAIESVCAQTRPSDEILVVDDCSTDSSREVAAGYPVTLLQTSNNAGHATARNVGIKAARGDLIAWLDADDYWEPNHLATVCGLLDQFPEAAVAYSAVRFIGAKTGTWSNPCCHHQPQMVFWECLGATIVPAMSAVTRTAPLLALGGFDESVRTAPDFDLWLRMSRSHPFVSTPEITSNYRWHASQISSSPTKQARSVYEARHRLYQKVLTEEDAALAAEIKQHMLLAWDHDLQRAFNQRDMKLLRFYLALRPLVPDDTRLSKRLRRRSRLPAWLFRAWDSAAARGRKPQSSKSPCNV